MAKANKVESREYLTVSKRTNWLTNGKLFIKHIECSKSVSKNWSEVTDEQKKQMEDDLTKRRVTGLEDLVPEGEEVVNVGDLFSGSSGIVDIGEDIQNTLSENLGEGAVVDIGEEDDFTDEGYGDIDELEDD